MQKVARSVNRSTSQKWDRKNCREWREACSTRQCPLRKKVVNHRGYTFAKGCWQLLRSELAPPSGRRPHCVFVPKAHSCSPSIFLPFVLQLVGRGRPEAEATLLDSGPNRPLFLKESYFVPEYYETP